MNTTLLGNFQKLENMEGRNGKVRDQLTDLGTVFQSYNSIIAAKIMEPHSVCFKIYLDSNYWHYSTTGKYRNIFLGETKKETETKIKSGEYILTDLN